MLEVPDPLARQEQDTKESADLIQWHTFSYRAVILWTCGGLVVVLLVLMATFPQWWAGVKRLLSTVQVDTSDAPVSSSWQARFTNLEGEVRVRKVNQVQWKAANVSPSLEEGDTVQTFHDGMARIAFADGTLYVVKPDTLIVIQQSTPKSNNAPMNVAVQVNSGTVDLSTSRLGEGSRVLFANAEASIYKESRAMVTSDPQTNIHQITVSKGTASLSRGKETLDLSQYEQATFAGPDSAVTRAKIVAPPILLTPANLAPVVMAGSQPVEVEFTWSAVPAAQSYVLRVSTSTIFASLVYERRVQSTSIRLSSFKEGEYYWTVTSIGAVQKESQPSDTNQFSVMRQGEQGELPLVVDKYVQHGAVIEIVGRTEPGATVLVNNEPVFDVAPDGSFKHFTTPLPNKGPNPITITAQNSKGKVATLRKTITIQ